MSQRTRANRSRNPGAAAIHRPPRYVRQVEHRKVRRAAHVELATLAEPEDHALIRPVHTSMKARPEERPDIEVRKRRFKVWKTKDWKRRSRMRAAKAAAYREMSEDSS